jgi:serine/threonine-protein kinase
LRLPTCFATLDVSRRHCLLGIAPPFLHMCDLGSKNGTYVNGVKIGQRECGLEAEAASTDTLWLRLNEGDELRVGGTTFRVSIFGKVRAREEERMPLDELPDHEPQDDVLVV